MADFTAKKLQFATEMIQLADRLLLAQEDCEAMDVAYSTNGFNPGGAHAFSDSDFNVQNRHLTAAIVQDVMFAIGTANTAIVNLRVNLIKALPGGLP